MEGGTVGFEQYSGYASACNKAKLLLIFRLALSNDVAFTDVKLIGAL